MPRMKFSTVVTAASLLLPAVPAAAQSGTASLISGPDIGRRAPDFTLPWASKDGVGPIEMPYQLRRDQGKTVVIAFLPRAFTRSSVEQLQSFAQHYDSLFGPEVSVVGITTDPLETQGRFAARYGVPFRLLSDPAQRVARKYGSNDPRGLGRRTIYVVGPDGTVKYRNLRFNPADPSQFTKLRTAVRAARTG
ncbi:MAG: redoxin domain-containing protein [Gemmatimonadales bacterium]|nr:redoxin domain-containing protein [Gemmatimonadales bacterium]